jgi:hypothetical protein
MVKPGLLEKETDKATDKPSPIGQERDKSTAADVGVKNSREQKMRIRQRPSLPPNKSIKHGGKTVANLKSLFQKIFSQSIIYWNIKCS